MTIGYNGIQFSHKMDGSKRLAQGTFECLLELDQTNQYRLFTFGQDKIYPEEKANFLERNYNTFFEMMLEEHFFEKDCHIDIFHTPHPFHEIDGLLYTPSLLTAPISIVTLLDLILFDHPEYFINERLYHNYKDLLRITSKWADKIITISEFVKKQLISTFQMDPEKIDVIYPGIDEQFTKIEDSGFAKMIKEKYNIQKDFMFNIGNHFPHKNAKSLVLAFNELKQQGQLNHQLVLAGKSPHQQTYEEIKELIAKNRLQEDIILLDGIGDKDLLYLYNAADVFLYPSLSEGFGIPPLEAMACGTPVIASDKTSIPEVLSDAALLVDAEDYHNVANGIKDLVTNSKLYNQLIEKGFKRVKKFSWENNARQHKLLYEKEYEKYLARGLAKEKEIYRLYFKRDFESRAIEFKIKKFIHIFKQIPILKKIMLFAYKLYSKK